MLPKRELPILDTVLNFCSIIRRLCNEHFRQVTMWSIDLVKH